MQTQLQIISNFAGTFGLLPELSRDSPDANFTATIMLSMRPHAKPLRPGRGDTRRSTLLLRPAVARIDASKLPKERSRAHLSCGDADTEGLAVMSEMASA
jgi:hypothetical protein